MTADPFVLRQDILALEAPLLIYARRMAADEPEAHELVRLTLETALEGEARPPADGDPKIWLYGLMRSAFHSVARRRATSRERGSAGRQWQPDRAQAFIQAAVRER
jgi:DNA-directed RNA polymerase specialized sigma24 family protein